VRGRGRARAWERRPLRGGRAARRVKRTGVSTTPPRLCRSRAEPESAAQPAWPGAGATAAALAGGSAGDAARCRPCASEGPRSSGRRTVRWKVMSSAVLTGPAWRPPAGPGARARTTGHSLHSSRDGRLQRGRRRRPRLGVGGPDDAALAHAHLRTPQRPSPSQALLRHSVLGPSQAAT